MELARELKEGSYAPRAVRQVLIPKKQLGKWRALGIRRSLRRFLKLRRPGGAEARTFVRIMRCWCYRRKIFEADMSDAWNLQPEHRVIRMTFQRIALCSWKQRQTHADAVRNMAEMRCGEHRIKIGLSCAKGVRMRCGQANACVHSLLNAGRDQVMHHEVVDWRVPDQAFHLPLSNYPVRRDTIRQNFNCRIGPSA